MTLGPLTFLAPLTLLGLLALPLIWWILKISPPRPERQAFPPIALMDPLDSEEETPDGAPLWLLLFRLLLVALAVFALALPLLKQDTATTDRPLTLIIDDGADAAPVWDDLMDEARSRLREAQRNNQDVILAVMSDPDLAPIPATEALQRLRSLRPIPQFEGDTLASLPLDRDTVFLSSGLALGGGDQTNTALREVGARVIAPKQSETALAAGQVRETASGLSVDWHSASGGRSANFEALSGDGRVLAEGTVTIPPGRNLATTDISLPPQLRSRITRLRLRGTRSSLSTKLLDDRFGRPLIGVLAPPSGTSSPLLSEEFYTQTALSPFADIFIGDVETVFGLNPSIVVMPDVMSDAAPLVQTYVEGGGLLLRFAGPRLAAEPDALIPVDLRQGGRSIGGALAWETPQRLAAFPSESPFSGLAIPSDVTVSKQVMARPGAEADLRTWARLEDGSPVVTSNKLGDGRIVLFHVTAGPDWSNLAISGLYVDMLKRILPLARAREIEALNSQADWVMDRQLDAFGELKPPPLDAISLSEGQISDADTLPGYYRQGSRLRARNVFEAAPVLEPFAPSGLAVERLSGNSPRSMGGGLLAIALIGLALDLVFSLLVSGRRPRWFGRPAALAVLTSLFCILLFPYSAVAQTSAPSPAIPNNERLAEAAQGLHLAFIETGDARIDQLSEAALNGLNVQLTARTTIEPVGVHGVTLQSAGLEMYPFLYWPVRLDTPALTDEERASLNRYLAGGGTLVLDTGDEPERAFRSGAPHPGLARVTDGLSIGRLVTVPDDHVITKSFYLLQSFPGRFANGPVFVESAGTTASGRDGVSSVIIGSHDWAAAWALDENMSAMVDLSNDVPRQREMAVRFGVNLAMYSLAGNYKADQVHAAELIRRLGDRRP